jgi:DNA-binding response OmpR family regulator
MQRVLVCDDERHIVRLAQVNLERQGHEVDTCTNADDCLAKLRTGTFDLLVVDSDMPNLIRQVEDEFAGQVRIMKLGKPKT